MVQVSTDRIRKIPLPSAPATTIRAASGASAGLPSGRDPGALLAGLSVVPALALAGWLIVGLPLLIAGVFRPLPTVLLALPVVVVLCGYGARRITAVGEATWWHTGGVLGLAVLFGVFNGVLHAEQIVIRRDPASYAQFAIWIAKHGSTVIPQSLDAFGGGDPALSFESLAFYQRDGAVIPQFMAGLPMVGAAAYWLGGTAGMLLVPPVLGAVAVAAFGGVVARLVGPRWAPLGSLALAVTLPMLMVSRSAYSETLVLVLLLGGLALLVDTLRPVPLGRVSGRGPAALAGLVLGLSVLVRIDGLRDMLPVVVYAGVLVTHRLARMRALAIPLVGGLVAGAGAGLIEGFLLSKPYLEYLTRSLTPLLWLTAAVAGMTGLVVAVLRLWRARGLGLPAVVGSRLGAKLGDAASVVTVLVVIGFAVRPLLQTVRDPRDDPATMQLIAMLQRGQGLPVDPSRQYAEQSLVWVAWYVGVPVVLLATLGAALLARRLCYGHPSARLWAFPLLTICWATVLTLWRPAITPDHPWASRRLVPMVIPGAILLATWALAWLLPRLRRRGGRPAIKRALAVAGVAAMVAPAAVISAGTAFVSVEQGEVVAVRQLCAAIGKRASVLIVDPTTGRRFTQVVRGMCDVPTARVSRDNPADVRRLIGAVRGAGRRPVLLGVAEQHVSPYGTPVHGLRIRTRQDEHSLMSPPNATWRLAFDVWLAKP